ncbi:MAG: Cas10/Cmr2 second palm domain-containing protein [Pseudonocardiaceae bacterium]
MPRYVDVGVKQVQTWLVRAPHLKGRRGASTMLTRATDVEVVKDQLAGLRAEQHHEAGHVDGVISVKVTSDHTGSDLKELCRRIERRLLDHLRKAAPAAFLEATWRDGDSYADAYDNRIQVTEHPPATSEWPAAKRCDWCHLWPAIHQIWDKAGEDFAQKDVCTDCRQRSDDEAAGRTTAKRFAPLAERRLLSKLAERGREGPILPDTFDELRGLGPFPTKDDTHLATIFADGNAIGGLIAHLRAAAAGPGVALATAPGLIDDATWNAAADAVVDITTSESRYWPVIPHLVGGDDLLVSVPAHCAWQFLRTYLASFVTGTQAMAVGGVAPSASAGVVIHHYQEPISVVVDLADELLRQAKNEHAGTMAALAWQSVTHDGSAHVQHQRSITAEDLHNSWDALNRFAAVAPSQRQVIARMLREGADVHDQLRRIRSGDSTLADLAAPFLEDKAPIPLPTALGLARWWWTR